MEWNVHEIKRGCWRDVVSRTHSKPPSKISFGLGMSVCSVRRLTAHVPPVRGRTVCSKPRETCCPASPALLPFTGKTGTGNGWGHM
ncbi:hypothetical protein E2C01_089594 [Portunus trituberculatus]|uniref:Uncharacterized protein n=1 Tax=Portunus trituberculatus TaxID=210409 RepID=A0A5B7JJG3_PORTR|nr:hypothetical protein [Portunus trituberculatus]